MTEFGANLDVLSDRVDAARGLAEPGYQQKVHCGTPPPSKAAPVGRIKTGNNKESQRSAPLPISLMAAECAPLAQRTVSASPASKDTAASHPRTERARDMSAST